MDNYITHAIRTEAPSDQRLLHCVLGLTTEMAEIYEGEKDIANFREELGDIMWYVAIGLHFFEAPLYGGEPLEPHQDLMWSVGQFANQMKRHIFYGTPLDREKMVGLLYAVRGNVESICAESGFLFSEILTENIHKLMKRFPEKFSEERAVNR